MNPLYLYNITQYRRILKDRNAYLKRLQLKQTKDTVFLGCLNRSACLSWSRSKSWRATFVRRLQAAAQPIQAEASPISENN